ncbi:MAG: M6 family metalloprotease domain-containing protein [bacterium]|nr:M6 family metalloprotease domain-containing protein [bacterium]
MLKYRVWLMVLGLLIATGSLASSQELHLSPAHPDLLKRLGRQEVARLHKAETPQRMASDMQLDFQAKSTRITGMGTCLVILWDFTDHAADQVNHPQSAYTEMMFSVDTFPSGSMNDYYREVSYGNFEVGGVVSGWNTDSNTYASYANGDGSQDANTARVMLQNAIAALDAVIDYSQFDNDGPDGIPNSGDDDGDVDSIFFVHSGPGEEQTGNPEDIWSHAWSFWNGLATNDGVFINRYTVEPEMLEDGNLMTMGVFAHEYGHALGLPDLYDTDYSSSGIGEWGLMSGGSWTAAEGLAAGSTPSHMSAWCKMQMGWLDPTVISSNSPNVSLPPVENNAVAYRVFRAGEANGDEYFLVENRRPIGFDSGLLRRQIAYGLAAPEGLVIYHIDDSQNNNSNDVHRLVDVVDASPWFHPDGSWHENLDGPRDYSRWQYLDNFNRGDNGDVWPGFTSFSADSTDWVGPRDRNVFSDESIPAAWDFDCNNTGVVLNNIYDDGENVTLDFQVNTAAGQLSEITLGNRTWDFETGTENFKFCNSYAHFDQSQADGCSGSGGLWFGSNEWDCPGYGNNWDDVAWVTVSVNTAESPSLTISHKYDLEPGYDYTYIEARPAGDLSYGWTQMASFNGSSNCTNEIILIPSSVLNAAENNGVSTLDIRFRLYSDGSYSAEDGNYCGIGWWIDEITVSQLASSAVNEIPGFGDVSHLNAPNPNPFNPATMLKYHIPTGAQKAQLVVFDQRGHQVRRLETEAVAGWHEVRWDGRTDQGGRVSSGLYFARLTVDGVVSVQKMALVK